jgi:fibronectin type III domain protein
MGQNAAIDRNAGAGGFDWAFHQYDTVGGDDDMAINNNLAGSPLPVIVNRDRWQETEADSGSPFSDVIRGDNDVPSTVGGAGFTGCDALDQAGLDRIHGLSAIVPTLPDPLAPVLAASATGFCPLTGNVWGRGNILIGGPGSDTIEGRGADDIIDGDRYLTARISVRTNAADPATEIGSTDLMEHQYLRDGTGALTGPTLQAAVFAGTVDPGNLVAVREIVTPPANSDTDTAVFSGPRANYTITNVAGALTVTQTGANVVGQKVSDGIDTLRNIEALKFSDQTVPVLVPAAPVIGVATASAAAATTGSVTANWTAPPANGGPAFTGYELVVSSGGTVVRTVTGIARTASSRVVTGLVNGTTYTVAVRAVNLFGAGPLSAQSNPVTPVGLPDAPTAVVASRGNTTADVSWTAPASNGGGTVTGWILQVRTGATVVRTIPLTGAATATTVTGLTNGTAYNFRVQAVNAVGAGALSTASNTVTPAAVPGAPGILAPTQGPAGGTLTAVANWTAPAVTGGTAITNYRVTALRMAADGVTPTGTPTVAIVGAAVRTRSFTLPAGSYRFEVVAINSVGDSLPSERSTLIQPR